jgi:hypothetical protein
MCPSHWSRIGGPCEPTGLRGLGRDRGVGGKHPAHGSTRTHGRCLEGRHLDFTGGVHHPEPQNLGPLSNRPRSSVAHEPLATPEPHRSATYAAPPSRPTPRPPPRPPHHRSMNPRGLRSAPRWINPVYTHPPSRHPPLTPLVEHPFAGCRPDLRGGEANVALPGASSRVRTTDAAAVGGNGSPTTSRVIAGLLTAGGPPEPEHPLNVREP